MILVDLALRNRSTVFFVMLALLVLGFLAYREMPRERYPDIDVPMILVYTPYPGAAPAEVESQLTVPIERELAGLEGIEELTSTSQEGLSAVTLEFAAGTDIDLALQKVRDRVDHAKVDFPVEAEEPWLQEISFSDFPIVQVNLTGDVGAVALKRLAEDLEEAIEAIPGVLRAAVVGGVEREVQVDVDPERLRLYGLSLSDVVDTVRDGHVSIPGGDLDLGDLTYAVRVPGEVEDPLAIADFVIEARDGRPVFVRDVASVAFGFKERDSLARIDSRESVALSVQKRVGANIIEVVDQVREILRKEQATWPEDVRATILGDLSTDIRRQVVDLENSILSGLVLVFLVLLVALGLRTALFVGLAIPFSLLTTFLILKTTGDTLNMVVLFALVLAVGMLVDNAVVVIENIHRHMQEGEDRLTAASRATHEVGSAVAVSTFTTLGAFAPLLFWPGVVGDFMSYLPYTVSIALLASLLVALTISPTLCSAFLSVGSVAGERQNDGLRARLEGFGERVTAAYRRLLSFALDHRRWVILATGLTFVAVAFLYVGMNLGTVYFPEVEPNQILVDVDMPPGTRLERTDEVIAELEGRFSSVDDIRVLASGSGSGSQTDSFGSGNDPNAGRLTLDLIDRKSRRRSSLETLEEVRALSGGLPGIQVDVDQPEEGPPVPDPVLIEISGDDFETLGAIAARIRSTLADIAGLVSLDDDFDVARPEVEIQVDRVAAAKLDLTTVEVARTVRTAINGTEAGTFRRGDEEIDITVRLQEASRGSLTDLSRLVVVTEGGGQVPIDAVAKIERTRALTSIRHKGRLRTVTVSGKVSTPRLAEPVRLEARRRVEAISDLLPAGYSIHFAGQSEDEEEVKAFLVRAFLYGVFIVLVLMVGKFDSMVIPAIIITSVMMSMIGVLIGLVVTRTPFGIVMTGVGVISLAGIVVNNAIVLIDYGEQLYRRGIPRQELVLRTGLRRLRPVLLTAVTTILGLIPLTTGVEFDFHTLMFSTGSESSQYWRSMGVAVIFGLGFATFLTLVLVPVLYDLLLQARERWGGGVRPVPTSAAAVSDRPGEAAVDPDVLAGDVGGVG